MKIRTFEYFIREAIASLRFNGLMSVASVSTVALSLLILGMFLIMVLNMNNMASALESQVQISVYLQDGLSDMETREIGTRITKFQGVTQVIYVSKEEALAKFKQRLGEQQTMLTALGDANPLPNAFEVRVDRPEQVKPAVQLITQIKGVENAKFGQEVMERIFDLTKMLRIIGFVLIVFLGLAATFIIANTIRITVFARRREIGIMKYVGATDGFIRWPFLIEGIILGFGGALIAAVLLGEAYSLVMTQVYGSLAFFPLIPKFPLVFQLGIVILISGTVIGAVGSTLSLRRFMKV